MSHETIVPTLSCIVLPNVLGLKLDSRTKGHEKIVQSESEFVHLFSPF